MPMQVGKKKLPAMRSVLEVMSYTTSRNASGEEVKTWNAFPDNLIRAAVIPVSTADKIQAQGIYAQSTHRILMRHYPGLESDSNRFRLKGTTRIFEMEGEPQPTDQENMQHLVWVLVKERTS